MGRSRPALPPKEQAMRFRSGLEILFNDLEVRFSSDIGKPCMPYESANCRKHIDLTDGHLEKYLLKA